MTRQDIEKILGDAATKETVDALLDAMHAEIKGHKDAAVAAQAELKAKTDELAAAAKGATDAKDLQAKLDALQQKYDADTKTAAQKMADMEFGALLDGAIREHKGRNAKAIRALLDIDALKASKNQREDVAAAVKALAEGDDAYLFGAPDGKPAGAWADKPGRTAKMTKAQIMDIKDPTERQDAIKNNMDLFQKG